MNSKIQSVLIVEDELIPRKELTMTLQSLGYVIAAETGLGEEAVERAAALKPDCVLMDIQLAGKMDGVQAAEIIASDYDIPVVFTTAYSDTPTLDRAKETSPYGFILKPFDAKELKYVLEMAIYRHGMEKKLRIREENFSNFFNKSVDLILICERSGAIVGLNETAGVRLGFSGSELEGRGYMEIIQDGPDDLISQPADILHEPGPFQLKLKRKNGTLIPAEVRLMPGNWNGQDVVFAVCRDQSELIDAETEVTYQRGLLEATLQSTADGILVNNISGEIVYCNKRFLDMWGLSENFLKGRNNQPAFKKSLKRLKNSRRFLQIITETAGSSEEAMDVIEFRDGRIFEHYSRPLKQGSDITGRVWSFRDITEEKKMLAALSHSEAKISAVIENTSDCIWSVDAGYQLLIGNTAFNDFYRLLHGRTPLLGESLCSAPEAGPLKISRKERYDRALAGEIFQVGAAFPTPKGEMYYTISYYPIRNGNGPVTGVACFARDVTEDKRNIEEITIIKRAVDGTSDAVSIAGKDGEAFYLNPAFGRIFGYRTAAGFKRAGGREALFADKEDADTVLNTLSANKPWSGEVTMLDSRNRSRDILLRADRILDDKGEILACIAVYMDITESKAVRRALMESENKLNRMAASLTDILYSVDGASGEFSYLSPSFEKVLGYTEADVTAMGGRKAFLQTVIQGDEFAKQAAKYREFAEHKCDVTDSWEAWWKCRDGSLVCLEDRYLPVYEGDQLVSTDGVLRDITLRKLSEKEIRTSEQKYRSLFNQIADPVVIFSQRDHRFLDCNKAAVRVYGYSENELKTMKPFDLHPPKELEKVRENIGECNRDKGNSYTHVTKDKRTMFVDIRSDAIDYQGEPAYISIIRDVTEAKKAGRQLKIAKEIAEENARQLNLFSRELELKNIKLETALKKAENATRLKTEFLANMSHEIRTPMNAIIGMTSLAWDLAANEEQKEYLDIVTDSSRNLLKLLNDILDYSKIEADRMELSMEEFSLQKLVSGLVQLYTPEAGARKLTFSCDLAPDIPDKVTGDAGRIQQVLNNLINNSLKFTEEGSVTLTAAQLPGIVTFDENRSRHTCTVHFAVQDTGIGIPSEHIGHIFDSFVQGDGSATRKYGGTGLGLAICRELIELMGGEIWVESEAGKGSTFQFYIPLKTASEKQTPNAEQTWPALPQPETGPEREKVNYSVLVAEDDAVNQIVIEKMLKKIGCSVEIAANGRDALDRLAGGNFDAVLMDIQMPVMNGLEAVENIRNAPEFSAKRRIPVIALTAHAFARDREECLRAGMDDFLVKPVSIDDLYGTLCSVVSGSDPVREDPLPEGEPRERVINLEAALGRLGGEREILGRVCETYLASAGEMLANLQLFLFENNTDDVEKTAHSLRSASANLGCEAARDAALAVELAARNHQFDRLPSTVASLKQEVEYAMAVLPSVFRNLGGNG